jgi:hypothetical protein
VVESGRSGIGTGSWASIARGIEIVDVDEQPRRAIARPGEKALTWKSGELEVDGAGRGRELLLVGERWRVEVN